MAGGLFGGGDGSAGKPYLIEDVVDLYQIRNHLTSCFRLSSNINCGEPPYNTGQGWKPIEGFTGYLDGNGKRIFNLTINMPDVVNVGFFKTLTFAANDVTCHVNDVSFESVHVVGGSNVGALAGTVTFTNTALTEAQAKFAAINVDGYVEGVDNVGGFVGVIASTTTTANAQFVLMRDCTSAVEICTGSAVAKAVGQFAGVFNDQSSPASTQVPVLVRCVGRGTSSANSKTSTDVSDGFLVYNPARVNGLVCTNCLQDATLWHPWVTSACTSRPTALSSADLRLAVNQVNLTTAKNAAGRLMFDVYDGQYPSLYFAGPDYAFIRADGSYYVYSFATSAWVVVSSSQPTRQQAISVGMRRLTEIPTAAWAFFKTFNDVMLVNIIDKKDSTTRGEFPASMSVDATNSTTDKTVFRGTVAFTTRDGAFAGVNF